MWNWPTWMMSLHIKAHWFVCFSCASSAQISYCLFHKNVSLCDFGRIVGLAGMYLNLVLLKSNACLDLCTLNPTLEESKKFSFSKTWCIGWNGKRSTSSHLMFDTLPQLIIGVFLIASQTQLIMNRRSINVMDGWMVQKLICCLFVQCIFNSFCIANIPCVHFKFFPHKKCGGSPCRKTYPVKCM